MMGRSDADCSSELRSGSRCDAFASTHWKVATNSWPALVDPAEHGVPVQGDAPSVNTRHDPPAPVIDFGHLDRDVVLSHEHHLEPATTRSTGGACYDCAGAFRANPCVHLHMRQPFLHSPRAIACLKRASQASRRTHGGRLCSRRPVLLSPGLQRLRARFAESP